MADNTTRTKLQAFLLRTKRKTEEQSEAIIRFAEDALPPFVRKHMDEDFESIYAETRREAYANWRQSVFDNMEAAKENESADDRYTETLKLLADFFDSTTFKGKSKAVLTAIEKQTSTKSKTKQKEPVPPKPDPMMPPANEDEGR